MEIVQNQTHQNPETTKAMHGPASAKRKQHRDVINSLKKDKKNEKYARDTECHMHDYEDEYEDEKAEVERRIMALQGIVPGCDESLGVDNLFEKTAAYILSLQCQLKALKALTNFFEGLEKEKMKFGC